MDLNKQYRSTDCVFFMIGQQYCCARMSSPLKTIICAVKMTSVFILQKYQ